MAAARKAAQVVYWFQNRTPSRTSEETPPASVMPDDLLDAELDRHPVLALKVAWLVFVPPCQVLDHLQAAHRVVVELRPTLDGDVVVAILEAEADPRVAEQVLVLQSAG